MTNQVSWLETTTYNNILLNTLDRCIVILKGEPLSLCDCFLCAEVPTNRKKNVHICERPVAFATTPAYLISQNGTMLVENKKSGKEKNIIIKGGVGHHARKIC